jgi:hypothetical protein
MRKTYNQEPYGLNPIWFVLILITIIALCLTACASKKPKEQPASYAMKAKATSHPMIEMADSVLFFDSPTGTADAWIMVTDAKHGETKTPVVKKKSCKHIWVEEYGASNTNGIAVVCIKCYEKDWRESEIMWGGTITIDTTITTNFSLTDSSSVYQLYYDPGPGRITYEQVDCEADCYDDWCCVCEMSKYDPKHPYHTPPLIPCH